MIRKIGFGLSFVLVAVASMTCAQDYDTILEFKDVQFFQARQINSSPVMLKLSGLAFHSSLAVRDITTSRSDGSLQILVHLTLARGNLSGNFDYTLSIPAAVRTVSFGKERVVIWNRNTGPLQQ
jgi:hypothetical protein